MASTKTTAKMNPKKRVALIAAIVLVAALLLGGAFAWTDFSQNFINRFRGGVMPDVLLHDDFQPWENKDVYVENPGEQDMYVRVQFKEFLQVGNQMIVGTDPKDKETWEIHQFFDGFITAGPPPVFVGDWSTGFDEPGGLIDSVCELDTHKYFDWYMTGEQKVYLKGTSEQGNENYKAMIIERADHLGIALGGVTENSPDTAFQTLIDHEDMFGPNGQRFGLTEAATIIMTIEDDTVKPEVLYYLLSPQ